MSEVGGLASSVYVGYAVSQGRVGSVVMGSDYEVNSSQTLEEVKPLVLKLFPVSISASAVADHYHHVRLLLCPDLVHIFLDEGDERLEMHPTPQIFHEPFLHVRVGVSKHGDAQPSLAENYMVREVSAFSLVPECVAPEERNALVGEFLGYFVVNLVSGLDVMVAYGHCVISHVGADLRKEVWGEGVDVIVVVGGVVSLEAVSGIEEDDLVFSGCLPDAVDHGFDGIE